LRVPEATQTTRLSTGALPLQVLSNAMVNSMARNAMGTEMVIGYKPENKIKHIPQKHDPAIR